MAFIAIDAMVGFTIGDFLLIVGVTGVVAGVAIDGAVGRHPADMAENGRALVAVSARERGGQIEGYVVMLCGVRIDRVDGAVAELAVARAINGAAFQHAGECGMAVVAVSFMGVKDEVRTGMAGDGTCRRAGEIGVRGWKMVGVVCASGLMTVDAGASAARGVAIGFGEQEARDRCMTSVTGVGLMDARGTISLFVARDAGGGG